ncbi:MAG: hypothetical protein H6791_01595 [Candidatus Nomurabacteria bacterium]|nr:MAG: hypothetical protein H6791_01595 [Candidatus Nomurabacteria bacterium]
MQNKQAGFIKVFIFAILGFLLVALLVKDKDGNNLIKQVTTGGFSANKDKVDESVQGYKDLQAQRDQQFQDLLEE